MRIADLDSTILEELVDLGPAEGIGLVRDLVQIFFAEAPNRMNRLRTGLAESDSAKVAQAAHSMSGGAGGLGAVGLASICSGIERQARTGDLTGLEAEVNQIADQLPGLEVRLGKLVRKLAASP
jgi:HPt (histidine-containing phosphotransfer) domain-containing protein